METRETGSETKALGLVSEYIKNFRFIHFTLHPGDIPGEAPGKSSNTAWAARKLSERYPLNQRKDVIITGIDGMFLPLSHLDLHSLLIKPFKQPIAIFLRITLL